MALRSCKNLEWRVNPHEWLIRPRHKNYKNKGVAMLVITGRVLTAPGDETQREAESQRGCLSPLSLGFILPEKATQLIEADRAVSLYTYGGLSCNRLRELLHRALLLCGGT